MTRRSFLKRLGAAAIGLTLARHLPGIAHKPPTLAPPDESIATRFIQYYDGDKFVNRFDVLYGFETLRPDMVCRVIA